MQAIPLERNWHNIITNAPTFHSRRSFTKRNSHVAKQNKYSSMRSFLEPCVIQLSEKASQTTQAAISAKWKS
eukprot:m.36418 g.36418  ORF g.36418 m.36418 type:complete len:72 (-) comp12471_c0_seq1:89-304(-)